MTNFSERMAALSPEKRALLELRVRKQAQQLNSFPLSFAQQRLWFIDQLEPGSSLYNIPLAVRLHGHLDIPALERTLSEIIRRHEVLRTTFPLIDGRPMPVITAPERIKLPIIDLQGFAESDREAEAQRLATEETQRPFDLAKGPVLRAMLLRLGVEDHVAVVTIHHITSDGWSTGVLVREVATLYTAFLTGDASPLPELPIQYADYAKWQREWLQGSVLESELDYWKQQLAGAPAVLELPTDHPRPAVQTFHGGRQSFRVGDDVAEALKAIGQGEGTTLFMTLLAAFKVLLSRYTGRDDIIVGSPIAGRNRAETEDLIGFFVNTLVLRTDTSGNPNFRQLLQRVREVTLGAYAHQDVPFEKLVEELQPERSLSQTPLFQVVFVLQNAPQGALELPGLSLSPMSYENPTSKFDLTLTMIDTEQGLIGGFEYNDDLFDAATIERMMAHFQMLLGAVAAQPDLPIAALPLLADDERRKLVREFNETARVYPQDSCLHQLFEEQVAKTPGAIALEFDEERLSYAELNSRANQLARHLRKLGVGPEVLVGVSLDRSSEMVVAVLAIMKAGGAYLPLDLTYPKERIEFMVSDAGVKILVSEETFRNIETESIENLPNETASSNLAYVIYTSGSTGQPKGVGVTHRSLSNFLDSMRQQPGLTSEDTLLSVTTLSFDIAGLELYLPLTTGGRLVLASQAVVADGKALLDQLLNSNATVTQATPATWRMLIAAGWEGSEHLRIWCGGEALPVDLAQDLTSKGSELWNLYGPTETTIWSALHRVGDVTTTLPIGRPIANTQIYILDQTLQPAPIGVAGELYIAGDGLARGYLNRAELTATRFVPDPFAQSGGARMYRTGDLARYRLDGNIEFLGRVDQQLKLRGFRIELGEIEAVLSAHDAVREAVVVAREEHRGDRVATRLVAYVVPQGEVSWRELREHLRARLPDYMVPAGVVFLSEMPLTNNGKLNRRALPALEETGEQESYVAPRTAIEELLCGIWSEVLGIEQVGVESNFFDLGGDSIRSIQVRANAQSVGLNFTVQQLFRHQTIAELAAEIGKSEPGYLPTPQTSPFSLIAEEDRQRLPSDVEDAYPLAMLQAGMLFHSQYAPDDAIYHVVSSVHFRVPFDAANIRAAVQQVAERHPILRTSFDLGNYTEPLQLVHRTVDVPLQIDDLRHLSAAEQEEAVAAAFEIEKQQPFDLERAPLMRFRVARRSDEDLQLTWAEHHAILDGWSVATMMTELLQTYVALCGEESSPPAQPLAVTYRDFVALERQSLESEESRDFWTEKLRDSAMTVIPRWSSSHATAQAYVQLRPVQLSEDLSRNLRRLASTLRVPLKSVFLAAHLRILSLLSGQEDVITGIAANGRPEEIDGERVLGLFINLVPIRLQLSGGTWAALVRQTFEAEREVMPYRRYPMAEMQRIHEAPLFETALNYTHFHVYTKVQEVEGVQTLNSKSYQATNFTFAANFSVDPASPALQLDIEGNGAELSLEQLDAIGGYYVRTLAAMASSPYARYEKQLLLSEPEQHQLLYEWNETETDILHHLCIHHLIEAQAEKTPDAIALSLGDRQITYREFNERANQLAHHLLALGVTAESRVGICCGRSVELMVGILGVLKAGGAYVPMDPAYPQERLSFMFEDTQIAVLLTQEHLVDDLPSHWAHTILLDAEWETIASAGKENPTVTLSAGNAAYVIYTSGSTGVPKGIVISHEALVNRMRSVVHIYGLGPGSCFIQFASIGFDAFVQEIFPTLICGARLALHPHPTRLTPAELLRECDRAGVNILQLPPAYWYQVIDYLAASKSLPECVKLMVTGGEAAAAEKLVAWTELTGSRVKYINAYGPAEVTVTGTTYAAPLELAAVKRLSRTPIGRPISNTQIYLLDPHWQPVPIATSGELCIGGIGLARGYLNRAELTADRFIPNPFSREPGARIYRTGDVARYLPTGEIEYLGRTDEQVKIRGFRIELGEIEAVLAAHVGVREALVVAREEQRGETAETKLVAYVVPHGEVSGRELRDHLRARLPEYMVPSAFVVLDQLPLTHHGKVDRRALPAPEQVQNDANSYLAPHTPLEEMLAGIWAEVLRFERVGIHDNFFDAGGHSLLATQVMSRVSHVFQVELPLRLLFESPTIAGLAASIEMTMRGGQGLQAPPLERVSRDQRLPLSFGQQRLWFVDRLNPDSSAYNFPIALRMRGRLNVSALDQTLDEVRRRHEVLRSTFPMIDGEPVQVIAPFEPRKSPIVDLSYLPEAEKESEARRLVEQEAQGPFNLADGPLMRTTLLRLGEEDHVFLFTMHHIITDGWSLNVLVREVTALYAAFCNEQPSSLPELPIQYADFAHWQRNWLQGEVLEEQLAYWKQQIGETPVVMELPTDRPRPEVETHRGANTSRLLSESLSSALVEFSRHEGVTLFMTLLAAFKTLLYRYTGQQDILLGTPISGRKQRETEDLIGFFVNTLVLRSQLHSDLTFRELLKRVMEATLGAFAHQDVPFEKLVQELDPNRDLSRQPLFQVVFMVQNGAPEVLEMPGLELSGMEGSTNTAKFDLIVAIGETEQGLNVNFEYNTDLFEASTISRLAELFETLLHGVVANPDQRLIDIKLIAAEDDIVVGPSDLSQTDEAEEFDFQF
jgi:amino acid adenylation domain-containing protein